MKRIGFLLLAVATLAGIVAYMPHASGQSDADSSGRSHASAGGRHHSAEAAADNHAFAACQEPSHLHSVDHVLISWLRRAAHRNDGSTCGHPSGDCGAG